MKKIAGKIRYKLNTDRGASIAMALLLFLVCAAIGASLVTAGSAASGRLSAMQEMDQRYYSVTSAAELVRDVICKEPVEFYQKKITVEERTEDDTTREISIETRVKDESGPSPEATGHMLDHVSALVAFGKSPWKIDNASDGDSLYERVEELWDVPGPDDSGVLGSWTFSVKPDSADKGILPVKVTAKLEGEDLIFTFENDGAGDKFLLTMTCTPDAPVIKNETTDTEVDLPELPEGTDPDPEDLEVTFTTTEEHEVWVNWTRKNCVISR